MKELNSSWSAVSFNDSTKLMCINTLPLNRLVSKADVERLIRLNCSLYLWLRMTNSVLVKACEMWVVAGTSDYSHRNVQGQLGFDRRRVNRSVRALMSTIDCWVRSSDSAQWLQAAVKRLCSKPIRLQTQRYELNYVFLLFFFNCYFVGLWIDLILQTAHDSPPQRLDSFNHCLLCLHAFPCGSFGDK